MTFYYVWHPFGVAITSVLRKENVDFPMLLCKALKKVGHGGIVIFLAEQTTITGAKENFAALNNMKTYFFCSPR